jgi:glycosyltransferase involved in cell wall biosynthesis
LSVSVVIPAYRRTYLRQAIASVLTQGFEDFELIIGDDSPGDEVAAVVSEFRDPRLRYVRTAGNTGSLENCRMLWDAASRPLLKYLLDDDLLMPDALIEMTTALETYQQTSFCFSNRYFIDAQGRVTGEAVNTPAGRVAPVAYGAFVTAMVPNISNPVGEFSNVLINRDAGVSFADIESYLGHDILMLTDIAFYLNASRKAPAVQIGKSLTAFRRHSEQNSSPSYNPRFSLGLCEWEIFLRCAYDAGQITRDEALTAVGKLERAYAEWLPRLDELKHVQPELRAFKAALEAGGARGLTPAFEAGLRALTAVTEEGWVADRARRAGAATKADLAAS